MLLGGALEGCPEGLLVAPHLCVVVADARLEVIEDCGEGAEVSFHLEVVAAALVGPPAADETTHCLEDFPESALLVVAHLVGMVVYEQDIPHLLLLTPVSCLGPVARVPLNHLRVAGWRGVVGWTA